MTVQVRDFELELEELSPRKKKVGLENKAGSQ